MEKCKDYFLVNTFQGSLFFLGEKNVLWDGGVGGGGEGINFT